MADQTVQIRLNFAALWSSYFIKLQHLLDTVTLLHAGATVVSEEHIRNNGTFMRVDPARNERLGHVQTVELAHKWLIRSFLRDAIEVTGIFMDDCLAACSAIDLAVKGRVTSAEFDHAINVLPLKRHKLHFPEKLVTLERSFGISTPLAPFVLSINRARTCVVHRLGAVSSQNVDLNNELVVRWYTTQFSARELESGKVVLLDRPRILIEQESMLQMQLVEHERRFHVGTQLSLTDHESYSTIITLWRFGISMSEAVEKYAQGKGIQVDGQSCINQAGHT